MSTTHTYFWRATGGSWEKAKYIYIWNSGAWQLLQDQWVSDGVSWFHGYTRTPGPLATITVSPSHYDFAQLETLTFTAVGEDADGIGVSISPTWSIDTLTDSINAATGDFIAGTTPDSGTVTCTVGGISGYATFTVT